MLTRVPKVPVARPQDMATPGSGKLTISPADPLIILGYGTKFTTEFGVRKQIMLPRNLGNAAAEVVEILDDTTMRIKKEFNKKATDGLAKVGGEGVVYKVRFENSRSRGRH